MNITVTSCHSLVHLRCYLLQLGRMDVMYDFAWRLILSHNIFLCLNLLCLSYSFTIFAMFNFTWVAHHKISCSKMCKLAVEKCSYCGWIIQIFWARNPKSGLFPGFKKTQGKFSITQSIFVMNQQFLSKPQEMKPKIPKVSSLVKDFFNKLTYRQIPKKNPAQI